MKVVAQQMHDLTQPVTLSVGGAVIFGLPVDDIIKIGTLTLLLLNIPLAGLRIHEYLTKNKK
ncbi:hypothetical protein [Bacterioplanoides sp.]|uniref:hypothetical protein n=1 Tax=Bacterioplanoides sp. TaxID=2066072 RepID=UPI003AFFE621